MTTEPARHAARENRARIPVPSLSPDFQMGEWRVHPSLCRLGRLGVEVRLRPQLMDLLCCLAMRAGQTVGRHEIFSAVWPGQFVAETGLPRCIAELRQVFHDDARDPTVIETIPKRGYRLLPPVAWAPDGDAPVQAGRPARGVRADLIVREELTLEARAPEATSSVVSASIAGGVDSCDRGIRADDARDKLGDPHNEALSGTRGRRARKLMEGKAARSAVGWRWRWISAWLTGTAVSLRSFVR